MKPPKRLSGIAIKEWKRVTKLIDLDKKDINQLICYCECWQRYTDLVTQLKLEPYTIPIGQNGAKQINPLVSMVRDELNLLLKYARRFGFDPESRQEKNKSDAALAGEEWNGILN